MARLFNLIWMPNSASNGFGLTMRTGWFRRFQGYPKTFIVSFISGSLFCGFIWVHPNPREENLKLTCRMTGIIGIIFISPFFWQCRIFTGSFHLNSFQFSNFQILKERYSNSPNFRKSVFQFSLKSHFLIFFLSKGNTLGFPDGWQNWILEIIMCAFPKNT